jgi:hypothetical protein
MGRFVFVAMLYVVSMCGFVVGGIELFTRARFALGAEDGAMKSSDPAIARAVTFAPNDSMRADVVYVTATRSLPVSDKYLSADQMRRLSRGETVPVRFLASDPHRVLREGEEHPSGLGWLIGGAAALAFAVYGHRRLHIESGAAQA